MQRPFYKCLLLSLSERVRFKPLDRNLGCLPNRIGGSISSIYCEIKENYTSSINKQSCRFSVSRKRRSLNVSITDLPERFRMEWPKITLFGDSITRRSFDIDNGCWGSQIAFNVGSYFDVDARGFEGYNSTWGLELMPKLFPKSYLDKVAIFVIFFGHNDSWNEQMPMHVDVNKYESNLRQMIKYLEDNGLERNKVIMITPTWYHDGEFQKWCKDAGMPPVNKELKDAEKYSETVLAISRDMSIDVVNFFATSLKQEPLESMFCDGVHLSRLGAKMLADQLMPVIEKKIEARYGKPLVDLWHVIPFDQHPEVKPVLEAYLKSKKQS